MDHVCNDELLESNNLDIRQFERNPHLETTIRAILNPKHANERARIIQEMTSKISQAVRCRWNVHRWGRVGPDAGKDFGWVSRGKVCAIASIILLGLLHEMIWLDLYIENKGHTHRSKRVCLGWGWFGNSVIPIHLHIWNLRGLRNAKTLCASQSEGKPNNVLMTIAYGWRGRVVVGHIVIGCVDVWWVMHFALHSYISHWMRGAFSMDAFLVVTSHVRILKYDTHG